LINELDYKGFTFFTRVIRFFYDFLIKDDMRLILKDDRRTSFKLTELRNNKEKYEKLFKRRYRF